jgi:putative chitinase
MNLNEKYKTLLNNSGINTPLRTAHFMAQIEHESHLKPIEESTNYSADRLLKIFPKYFDQATAKLYERRPIQIANKVYANRMGNGNETSGDGYKYLGRGFIQLTGKSNYQAFKNASGIDVVSNPELLLEEANAMICAIWFWNKNGISELADQDDIVNITKRINGGITGLEDRKALLVKYKTIFNYKNIAR